MIKNHRDLHYLETKTYLKNPLFCNFRESIFFNLIFVRFFFFHFNCRVHFTGSRIANRLYVVILEISIHRPPIHTANSPPFNTFYKIIESYCCYRIFAVVVKPNAAHWKIQYFQDTRKFILLIWAEGIGMINFYEWQSSETRNWRFYRRLKTKLHWQVRFAKQSEIILKSVYKYIKINNGHRSVWS